MKPLEIRFDIEETDELIAAESGLTLIGSLIRKTHLDKRLESSGKRPQIKDIDIIKSYISLLAMGKTEFVKIEHYRGDGFYKAVMGIPVVPSEENLRQRMDAASESWKEKIIDEGIRLIKRMEGKLTPSIRKLVPLDIDVSPFNNEQTKKEGVSRTYAGYDGYAPIFAYLGKAEGWIVGVELREGKRHSQCDKGEFIRKAIQNAKILTQSILVRVDSGNDSNDTIKLCAEDEKVDFIIKRNLRKEDPLDYLERIKKSKTMAIEKPREGKTVYRDKIRADVGLKEEIWMVYEVIVRTIDKYGNPNLLPDIEVKAYWTSLADDADMVIRLYEEHGTSEQFHSEIKSDIGLERFPSGKFKTNSLVLALGCFTYNLLRWAGQETLRYKGIPGSKAKERIRLKTIIQDIMYMAAKLVSHARKYVLKICRQNTCLPLFRELYGVLTV
jgi:hypothetical protein